MTRRKLPQGIYGPRNGLYGCRVPLTAAQAAAFGFKTRRPRQLVADTVPGAEKYRFEALGRVQRGEHPFPRPGGGAAGVGLQTVAEIVERYLRVSASRSAGGRAVKARLAKNVVRYLGDKVAATLTESDLAWFRDQRAAEAVQRNGTTAKGRTAGPATVKLDLRLLCAALNSAKDETLIGPHVFDALSKAARKRLMPKNRRPFQRVSDEMFAAILAELPGGYHRIAAFLLFTGMRKSEAESLTWGQVSRGEVKLLGTKNGEDRVVELSPDALAVLGKRTAISERVFAEMSPGAFERAWIRARKRAGLTTRIHDLRGEFASRYDEGGGTMRELMDVGGWKSLGIIEHYLKPRKERIREVLQRMSGAAQTFPSCVPGRASNA